MADRPRCASSSEISLRSHENHRSYGPILYVDWAYCLGQESCIVTLEVGAGVSLNWSLSLRDVFSAKKAFPMQLAVWV